MKRVYFTITGTRHRLGHEFMKPKMKVWLEKEPDNEHDGEAIKVMMEGLGHVGYVANSPWTVLGESLSAGRLYDRIGDRAEGKVRVVLDKGVICSVRKSDILWWPPEREPRQPGAQRPDPETDIASLPDSVFDRGNVEIIEDDR